MSKKIDAAAKELRQAVKKHQRVVADDSKPKRKVQQATARLRAAAAAYAALVFAQTGAESPFVDIADPRLHVQTVSSLKAERDALARKRAAKHADAATRGN